MSKNEINPHISSLLTKWHQNVSTYQTQNSTCSYTHKEWITPILIYRFSILFKCEYRYCALFWYWYVGTFWCFSSVGLGCRAKAWEAIKSTSWRVQRTKAGSIGPWPYAVNGTLFCPNLLQAVYGYPTSQYPVIWPPPPWLSTKK